jgi:mRNA-degrading endonuclease RelE of RelBE toxin-antitoxin system
MDVTFVETSNFTAAIEDYFGSDDRYFHLQDFLLRNPESGAVIPGTGGVRKLRWPDPRRGKGKRGGLRVIYLHVPEADVILFLDVYDKDEADDLSAEDKRLATHLARQFRDQVIAWRKRR